MSTRVNMGTKMADRLIAEFNNKYYKGETLYKVYGKCSSAKVRSWESIKRTCEDLNGWNLHITGASSHSYSCIYAFNYTDDEGKNWIILRKETSRNTYDLYLDPDVYIKFCG